MDKREYEVNFHLINGNQVLTTYESDSEINSDMYLEVIEATNEFYKVKDNDGILHNISKNYIVDITIHEILHADLSVINF